MLFVVRQSSACGDIVLFVKLSMTEQRTKRYSHWHLRCITFRRAARGERLSIAWHCAPLRWIPLRVAVRFYSSI